MKWILNYTSETNIIDKVKNNVRYSNNQFYKDIFLDSKKRNEIKRSMINSKLDGRYW